MSNTFISKKRNDAFSYLRGVDLQYLLTEVIKFDFIYRDTLDLPKKITFGTEIEYEEVRKSIITKFINKNMPKWKSVGDASLVSGGEINSPIMNDEIKYWNELKEICNFLTKKGADTSHNAAGHIHIGAKVFGGDYEAWRVFLKLYIVYEHVLFRFLYGDKISARKKIMKYAPPLADDAIRIIGHLKIADCIEDIRCCISTKKYSALNFAHVSFSPFCAEVDNTIEFRSPNATVNEIIWQNNINVLAKMVLSSVEQVMDEEFLDYKLKNEFLSYETNPNAYNEVVLKSVLEFVDLVFDNNLDKIYFLKQYLKDFESNYGINHAVFAKSFVK